MKKKRTVSRKIPVTMFSQHPDHAKTPYWKRQPFVTTQQELEECYRMFHDLKAKEVMWDWEGKLVDEAVVEKLLTENGNFFAKLPLGKEVFLTFRVPNPRIESGFRLGRAFMVIVSSQHLAHTIGLPAEPLFEVILPMTETARELIDLQKRFQQFKTTTHSAFDLESFHSRPIEVIPLFEKVEVIMKSGQILREYVKLYAKEFGSAPEYLRPFCARSDPALNSGIVPTTLAIKWAMSEYEKFSEETNIPTFPIIAPGALPFRGGLTPESVAEFLREFAGMRTIVIQSAFRYDYPKAAVKSALQELTEMAPKLQTERLPGKLEKELQTIIEWFEQPYQAVIQQIAPLIQQISVNIPKRRERLQHIGLFGYSRKTEGISLPRAIGFTASCYSLGIPPELFGTGSGLLRAKQEGKLKIVESLYKNLKPSLLRAGKFLRKESLQELGLDGLVSEVEIIEKYLGEKLGPHTTAELKHQTLVAQIITLMKQGKSPKKEIEQAALLRHSLG